MTPAPELVALLDTLRDSILHSSVTDHERGYMLEEVGALEAAITRAAAVPQGVSDGGDGDWLNLREGVVVGTHRPDIANGRYVWVDILPSERAATNDGADALAHMFPGVKEGLASLSSGFPTDDEQFCNEHGMIHSVELRSASCRFDFEEVAKASENKSHCSDERPCTPRFSDSGPCDDTPPPAELGKGELS